MQDTYLGKIQYIGPNFSRISPLASFGTGIWTRLSNPREHFPRDGRAFVPAPLQHPKDSLVVFAKAPNRVRSDASDRPDEFLALDVRLASIALDFTSLTLEQARQKLFEEGFSLPSSTGHVYALLKGGLYWELKDLKREGTIFRLEPRYDSIPLSAFDCKPGSTIECDGAVVMPPIVQAHGEPLLRVDWSSDELFLERALNRFRKLNLPFEDGEYSAPAKSAIAFIVQALRKAELLPNREPEIKVAEERLHALLPRIQGNIERHEEFRRMLLDSEGAKRLLEAERDAVKEETKRSVREETERLVRTELESVDTQLRRDISLLEQSKATLSLEIEELQQRCTSVRGDLRDANERVESARSAVANVTDQLQRGLLRMPGMDSGGARSIALALKSSLAEASIEVGELYPGATPPWSTAAAQASVSLDIGLIDLNGRLKTEADAFGVAQEDLEVLDGFARAGEIVLLLGEHPDIALSAYAQCVSGGHVVFCSIDPSNIGVDDLWRLPGSQAPTALAHAWLSATSNPGRTVLLCLNAIDSAPAPLWLPAFRMALNTDGRPKNLMIFAVAVSAQAKEEPGEALSIDLKRYVLPLAPRSSDSACLKSLRRRPHASKATTLVWPAADSSVAPTTHTALIRSAGTAPPTSRDFVQRALRLADALAESGDGDRADTIATKWFSALASSASSIPEPFKAGYDLLTRIHWQR